MKSPYALEKLEGTCRIDIPIQGTELPTSLAGITAYKHLLLPCNHHLVDTPGTVFITKVSVSSSQRIAEDTDYPKPVKR